MKIMSDFREAMWGVLQAATSTLDFDFQAYSARYFGRVSAGLMDSRLDEWLADVTRESGRPLG